MYDPIYNPIPCGKTKHETRYGIYIHSHNVNKSFHLLTLHLNKPQLQKLADSHKTS